ncbi:hypothetical protein GALL_74850 [mine drainage metagenome]|uniref:Uncharacterized protein n=1 Tax=mine drainage metagenome TaxID=410659 RepID=A0A1J5SRU6_9ZZZZ
MIQRVILSMGLIAVTFQMAGCEDKTIATGKLAKDVANVRIQVKGELRKLKINEQVVLPISIFNNGVESIPSQSKSGRWLKVYATYHWLKASGETAVWDGIRTELPADIKRGKSIDVALIVKAPSEPGKYSLVIDLVQEGVQWFADTGSQTTTLTYFIEQ